MIITEINCKHCGRRCHKTFGDDERCADCYRVWARTQPPPVILCEVTGASCFNRATYHPAIKTWRCKEHRGQ